MRRRALVLTVCGVALTAASAGANAAAGGANVLRALAGPIANAKRHGLKVLVPSTIVAHASRVYGSGSATGGGYDLQLADAPGCHDADACFVAEFTAESGGPKIAGAAVALAGGRRGHFLASHCGASCSPATIQWREYGFEYTIQYMGSRRQLVALAGSAISAGPR